MISEINQFIQNKILVLSVVDYMAYMTLIIVVSFWSISFLSGLFLFGFAHIKNIIKKFLLLFIFFSCIGIYNNNVSATNLDISRTQKINNGSTYGVAKPVNPGDIIKFSFGAQNYGIDLNNIQFKINSSNNGFNNLIPLPSSYKQFSIVNSNIATGVFDMKLNQYAPICSTTTTDDYLELKTVSIQIQTGYNEGNLVINGQTYADGFTGNLVTKTYPVNVKPHIIDVYFMSGSSIVTGINNNGDDSIDLIIKVKDYNSCENINGGSVVADLSELGLSPTESLSYIGCLSGNIATFQKNGITTQVGTGIISFSYGDFVAIDEYNFNNDPADINFGSIDYKGTISFLVFESISSSSSSSVISVLSGGSINVGFNDPYGELNVTTMTNIYLFEFAFGFIFLLFYTTFKGLKKLMD